MGSKYSHLSFSEREEISRQLARGASVRAIARTLGRSPSTISREIRRCCGSAIPGCYRDEYRAEVAAIKARGAQTWRWRYNPDRKPRKIDGNENLKRYIIKRLRRRWSPEQIAERLKKDYPDDMTMRVSHETIYAWLYCKPRGYLKEYLCRNGLRRKHATRRPKGSSRKGQSMIPNLVSIHDRPAEVEDRHVPGHWEGDLICGKKNQSHVGSLVERSCRLLYLIKIDELNSDTVCEAFEKKFDPLPEALRKSMTYDRGFEMRRHERITENVKVKVYFADPRSPWQRGTNENTNGLVRQYLPKGTDLSEYTQEQLDEIAEEINNRPRKSLDFATPNEVFQQLAFNEKGVAL